MFFKDSQEVSLVFLIRLEFNHCYLPAAAGTFQLFLLFWTQHVVGAVIAADRTLKDRHISWEYRQLFVCVCFELDHIYIVLSWLLAAEVIGGYNF